MASWQQRLLALTLAGGGVSVGACALDSSNPSNGKTSSFSPTETATDTASPVGPPPGGHCNANPDPCCGQPDGPDGPNVCKDHVTISGPSSKACMPTNAQPRDRCCGYPDSAMCKDGVTVGPEVDIAQCDANPDPCCGRPDGAIPAKPPSKAIYICKDGATFKIYGDAGIVDAAPE